MRTVHIEFRFKRTETPSLGLTLLRDLARTRGHDVAIKYANLDFADRVGPQTYQRILDAPSELLLGDLVFVTAAFGRDLTPGDQTSIVALARIGNRDVDLAGC
jgi:hypothetical protein